MIRNGHPTESASSSYQCWRMQRKAMTNVPAPIDSVSIRTANRRDLPALISLINKAFAIETFLEGTRTDEERLSATMRDGDLLMAERDGQAVACVYVELRGEQ